MVKYIFCVKVSLFIIVEKCTAVIQVFHFTKILYIMIDNFSFITISNRIWSHEISCVPPVNKQPCNPTYRMNRFAWQLWLFWDDTRDRVTEVFHAHHYTRDREHLCWWFINFIKSEIDFIREKFVFQNLWLTFKKLIKRAPKTDF